MILFAWSIIIYILVGALMGAIFNERMAKYDVWVEEKFGPNFLIYFLNTGILWPFTVYFLTRNETKEKISKAISK